MLLAEQTLVKSFSDGEERAERIAFNVELALICRRLKKLTSKVKLVVVSVVFVISCIC